MRYKEGYLYDEEVLYTLPVNVLEDIILRIHRDAYLSKNMQEELLKDYLSARKYALDKTFSYTEENLKQLADMNRLLEQQSIEAIQIAWQVYQEELAEKISHADTYRDVRITPYLYVPKDLYEHMQNEAFLEKEELIWDILCSPNNSKHRINDILVHSPFCTSQTSRQDLNAVIRHVVYGCQGNEEPTPWGMAGLDREKIKDIRFVWPFHSLFEFCNFSIIDILKIKKFNITIKVEDEVL